MTQPQPDARVRSAVAHWASRCIANGIDYNDFMTTLARIPRWGDWCAEWMATARVHEALAQAGERRASPLTAAEARVRAGLCHHFGKFLFFEDAALALQAHEAMLLNFRLAGPDLDPPIERIEAPFEATALPGYLRRPPGAERPPVVILVPGLDSTKEEFHTFEPLLLRRGLATLAIDGPGQGELERTTAIRPDYERALAAVVDWIEGRDDLDAGRIGAVGVSLGGYYVARGAAHEARLRAVAEVAGPHDLGDCWPDLPLLTREAFARRSGTLDMDEARRRAHTLTLEGATHLIRIPLLIVHGEQDRIIPVQQAWQLHAAATSATKHLAIYAAGTHVCNNLPYAYRPLVADWLAHHLAT